MHIFFLIISSVVAFAFRFGVDPSVHKFIRTTWQAYYWGPWSSWKFVPEERRTSWWHTFIVCIATLPFTSILTVLHLMPSLFLCSKTITGKRSTMMKCTTAGRFTHSILYVRRSAGRREIMRSQSTSVRRTGLSS